MRILIHSRTFLPRVGGLEQTTLALSKGLSELGHHVVVATDVAADSAHDRELGFEVVRQASVPRLVALARTFELVHSNGHGMVAFVVAGLARRPLIVTHQGYQAVCLSGLGWHGGRMCGYSLARCLRLTCEHEGPMRATRQLFRHAIARATIANAAAHVAISRFVADTIRIPNVDVVFNSADTALFRPAQPSGVRDAFLFVGRFVGEKGVPFLLEAFARYRQTGGVRALELVGAGPEEAWYRRRVDELRIGAWVRFRGTLRGEALAQAYRESFAVLVPSVWDEAFGIVAAEALCSGRVALVSRVGGLSEVAVDESATVPPNDLDGWARAMHRLEQDERWRGSLEAALSKQADLFTPNRMVSGYLAIYKRVLGARAVPTASAGTVPSPSGRAPGQKPEG